jgi:hypothetical protein
MNQLNKNKMKKLILLVVVTCILTATVNASNDASDVKQNAGLFNKHRLAAKKERREEKKELQKLKGSEVSAAAVDQFARDFENVHSIVWERTINFDEATFTKDDQVFTAYYDDEAKLVGTTESKVFTDLPSRAQAVINDDYKAYSVMDVFMFDDNEDNQTDMSLYNKQFDDEDSYFVELRKDNKEIILQVRMDGDVSLFTRLK